MKLARNAFVVVRNDDFRRDGCPVRRTVRAGIAPSAVLSRPAATRLTAVWHIDPMTQRLVCSWSREPAPEEGQPLSRINAARPRRAAYRR